MTTAAFDVAYDAIDAFNEEAAELLRNIDVGLNDLLGADEQTRKTLGRDMLRWLHTLKGAASVVGLDDVRQYVHGLEELMRAIHEGKVPLDADHLAEFASGLEDLHILVQRHRPEAPPREPLLLSAAPVEEAPAPAAAKKPSAELLRLRPERVDALHALVGELVVTRLQYDAIARRLMDVRDQSSDLASELRSFGVFCAGLRNTMLARTHTELLTRLGRIVETAASAARDTTTITRELGLLEAQSSSVSTSIEDGIRELRLVPLNTFFEDFARTVREAARETGKDARLLTEAGSAEIDRSVMMRLRDALGHLVRNAITHGIESKDERELLGKNPTGLVKLEGHCAHSRAVIRVIDDGGGVDIDQVRRKAVRLGILRENESLSEDALLDILTQSGFSTRESADGLAGRGIGLDVVAAAVRALDGHIEMTTKRGIGTIFTIEVPVTASTGLGLVVKVGEHSFGILLTHVERAIRIEPKDIQSVFDRDTIMLDSGPISVVSLAELVGLPSSTLPAHRTPAVVLRMGKQRLIATVDDVPGDQTLVVKPLGRAFAAAQHLSGAAVQPDGSTLPVLHVPALFARATASRTAAMPAAPKPRKGATSTQTALRQRVVLVVDDSMTIRTLLRNILRADNYEVIVAHDGKAGLDALANMPHCDLVITDLEMPRMNGVELCRAIRRSAHAQLPVMVVTSVGDSGEKRRALESGADAYIIKSEFEQARFLDVVARLSGRLGRSA
ncbi:MAG: response regulator [Polyangiaceae bacterium]|nr:response regulator [Polyangiaceae bacterium]